MLNLARLSQHPLLAPYFEAVNPFFWPVLIWQLMKMASEVTAAGRQGALIRISWWGGVRIEYLGDPQPDPSAYRPLEPARKPWSDPCWSSNIPADLCQAVAPLFFPRKCGGFEGKAFALQTPREGMKGVSTLSPIADTS